MAQALSDLYEQHQLRGCLENLKQAANAETRNLLAGLRRRPPEPSLARMAGEALLLLSEAQADLRYLTAMELLTAEAVVEGVDKTAGRLATWLTQQREPVAQLPVIGLLEALKLTSLELEPMRMHARRAPIKLVTIPSEFLQQLRKGLFPAERVLIIAGRKEGNSARATASFDVTGKRSMGHVVADQGCLTATLVSIEMSGAMALLWAHSHPGRGPDTTMPSSLDLQQQAQWSPAYSAALTGIVFSEDGYFRFFGDAYIRGEVRIEFEGDGIEAIEGGEGVFRLTRA